MNVPLTLSSGGAAAIIHNDGEHVVVASSASSPPGSTLTASHEGIPISIKVRGCARDESSAPLVFRIDGRLLNFSRSARLRLFGATPP
ncbi:MAG TPA: hypothetical protein VGI10_22890 [Polyangiaceae bacterium]|jgi:hypothetical protein